MLNVNSCLCQSEKEKGGVFVLWYNLTLRAVLCNAISVNVKNYNIGACVCVCVCARTHLYGVDGQLYFLPGLPGPKGIMRTMPSAYVCVCVCVCVSMV